MRPAEPPKRFGEQPRHRRTYKAAKAAPHDSAVPASLVRQCCRWLNHTTYQVLMFSYRKYYSQLTVIASSHVASAVSLFLAGRDLPFKSKWKKKTPHRAQFTPVMCMLPWYVIPCPTLCTHLWVAPVGIISPRLQVYSCGGTDTSSTPSIEHKTKKKHSQNMNPPLR